MEKWLKRKKQAKRKITNEKNIHRSGLDSKRKDIHKKIVLEANERKNGNRQVKYRLSENRN